MKKNIIIAALLILNAITCFYGVYIARDNTKLFNANQTYIEQVKLLRTACVALDETCKDQRMKLNAIRQELEGVDFDYIVSLPGGMDLKVQIIKQTLEVK